MATFTLKQDNEEVTFEGLPPGPVKELFHKLMTTIDTQLHSLQCETHHREPSIVLHTVGTKVKLAGFGACCREFGNKVKDLIKLPEEMMDPEVAITTRELTYMHQE